MEEVVVVVVVVVVIEVGIVQSCNIDDVDTYDQHYDSNESSTIQFFRASYISKDESCGSEGQSGCCSRFFSL